VGTIGTGTWAGTTIAANHGGSGVANTATHTLGTSNQNWATLGTGIVKNTTTTGALSNALSADVAATWIGTGCGTTTNVMQLNGNCTPVGSGAVSSVSNSDGTLTISPTTGAVVASLALGNANSWTGLQTFGAHASIASTAHGVLLSENTGAVVATSAGTSTQCFISNGSTTDPSFQTCPSGTSGISGLTANYIPLAGSATTITANSHIDDGATTASTLTASEQVAVNDG
jgi:hypothetical protein